ncbi:swi2/snf2-like protein [Morchella snyderi]|nr:swi2/snf2-like protein [Morchella snyderi]
MSRAEKHRPSSIHTSPIAMPSRTEVITTTITTISTATSPSSPTGSASTSTPTTSTSSHSYKDQPNAAATEEVAMAEPIVPPPVPMQRARLDFLIKQSSVYANIMADKLLKQQQEMAARAEEEDRRARALATAPPAAHAIVAPAPEVRKSGRNNAAAAAAEKQQGKKPAKKKPGQKPTKAKGKAAISGYFIKDKLKEPGSTAEALANAQEPTDQKLGLQKDLRSARQPKLITGGVMKPYQLQGLDWLVSLYENGLNGILADEMGLGKTLQTISFLAFLKEKGTNGPFLVAAPVSTLSNWVDEIERFAPEMPVLMYHGTPVEREEMRQTSMAKKGKDFPIICTSYELIMNDRKYLQKYAWKFIIIDEGHRIKNLNCKLVRELKSYTSANRLLITGTPLQNNLSELWSLLNFLLPDIFDDLDSFQNWFDFTAIQEKEGHHAWLEEQKKTNIVGSLHAILKPFLLRRMKTDVETMLPPKREYVLYAPLTQSQKDLYGKLLNHEGRSWLIEKLVGSDATKKRKLEEDAASKKRKRGANDSSSSSATPQSKKTRSTRSTRGKNTSYKDLEDHEFFAKLDESSDEEEIIPVDEYQLKLIKATKDAGNKKLQNLVMQLRQACNSPHLFYWPFPADPDNTIVTESGKMMLLDRLVPALFARGHKVLIFSQFSKMLDIIEEWASTLRSWQVCRIDGAVSQTDRREQIRRFNHDAGWNLFLLSTRAGGLGINLTAADTVVLFDSDWNPQQDLQAQDRAHRIGQKKPVIVYRFATAATVEQTLLEKADGKRRLEKLVIQKGKFKSVVSAVPAAAAGSDHDELSSILLREDFEKVNVVQAGQQVLSDAELETLMDRSAEAYERAEKGGKSASGAFRVVETVVKEDDEVKKEGS